MNNKIKTSKMARVLLVFVMCIISAVVTFGYIYYLRSAQQSPTFGGGVANLSRMFVQHIITVAPSIVMLLVTLVITKRDFKKKLFLSVKGKKQKILIISLFAVLSIIFIIALVKKQNILIVCYQLFYYTVIIAFFEEFIYRGLYPAILKDVLPEWMTWVIPSFLFGTMHFFSTIGFDSFDWVSVFQFIRSSFLGYAVGGILFELIKRKSGTIWVPVLIHAILNFMGIFAE